MQLVALDIENIRKGFKFHETFEKGAFQYLLYKNKTKVYMYIYIYNILNRK